MRALSAYFYGSEGGIGNDAPNPWALRLSFLRVGLITGMLVAGISAGSLAAGWFSQAVASIALFSWLKLGKNMGEFTHFMLQVDTIGKLQNLCR